MATPVMAASWVRSGDYEPMSGSATVVLGVWMRDLLGVSDDLEGWRQSVWIGRLVAPVGQLRLGGQAASHDLLRVIAPSTRAGVSGCRPG